MSAAAVNLTILIVTVVLVAGLAIFLVLQKYKAAFATVAGFFVLFLLSEQYHSRLPPPTYTQRGNER
jgi:hypothetical protein